MEDNGSQSSKVKIDFDYNVTSTISKQQQVDTGISAEPLRKVKVEQFDENSPDRKSVQAYDSENDTVVNAIFPILIHSNILKN
jgi:hypothetical protein